MPDIWEERQAKDFTNTQNNKHLNPIIIMEITQNPKESIKSFISRSIQIEALDENENLFESGIVNSLFAIQLMTFLEKTFHIEVTMDDLDMENFRSINSTAAFVERKCNGLSAR